MLSQYIGKHQAVYMSHRQVPLQCGHPSRISQHKSVIQLSALTQQLMNIQTERCLGAKDEED